MKSLKNSANIKACAVLLVSLSLSYSLVFSFQAEAPHARVRKYIEGLVRTTIGYETRALMDLAPELDEVKILRRYITVITDDYMKTYEQKKPLPETMADQQLNSYLCKVNLMKILEVTDQRDLQYKLGLMGILYDSLMPCNTWKQIEFRLSELIKRKTALIKAP